MSEILNNQVETIYGESPKLPSPNVPIKDYDTVTIKRITFLAKKYTPTIFMLWCSYTNTYVTSFMIDDTRFYTDETYDIVIKLNKNAFDMKFKVFFFDPAAGGELSPYTDVNALNITLEFNKYTK